MTDKEIQLIKSVFLLGHMAGKQGKTAKQALKSLNELLVILKK